MKIEVKEKEISIEIKRQNSSELAPCPRCKKGHGVKKFDDGYITADELGRPPGAKGMDVFSTWIECDDPRCAHKMDVYKWPVRKWWVATIEDKYGNYMTHASDFDKETAIRKASNSFKEMEKQFKESNEDDYYSFGDC